MKRNPHSYTAEESYNIFKMKPEAAIEYFGGKELITDWQSIIKDAHSRAFTVAGETREAVLADLYSELQAALDGGGTMETFRANAMLKLQNSGWLRGVVGYDENGKPQYESNASTTYDRLERIYRTNLQVAHAAGRYESIMKSQLEFVEYVIIADERTRDEHRAAAGVYHISDDFLKYFAPPNGFNCRCLLQGRTEAWLRRHGYDPDAIRAKAGVSHVSEREAIEKDGSVRTYHEYDLGNGKKFTAGKGWDYNPALSFYEQRAARPLVSKVAIEYKEVTPEQVTNKAWLDGLSEQGQLAINRYTGTMYKIYNGFLRGEEPDFFYTGLSKEELLNDIAIMVKEVGKSEAPLNMLVKRVDGGGFLNSFKVDGDIMAGQKIRGTAFLSTMIKKTRRNAEVKYTIRVPKGSKGAYVTPISNFQGEGSEYEWLIQAGSFYKYIGVDQDGNHIIELLLED